MPSQEWIDRHMEFYVHARKVFKQLFGYDLYLIAGGLLGMVREGNIIDHDYDLDVGYLTTKRGKAYQDERFDIITGLHRAGEHVSLNKHKGVERSVRTLSFWRTPDGQARIDLFPCRFRKGYYVRGTFVCVPLAYEDIMPLREVDFLGYPVLIPNNPEKKVAAVYGREWRMPLDNWMKRKVKIKKSLRSGQKRMIGNMNLLSRYVRKINEIVGIW